MLRRDMKPGDVFYTCMGRPVQVLDEDEEICTDDPEMLYCFGSLYPNLEFDLVEEDEDPGRPCAWGYE